MNAHIIISLLLSLSILFPISMRAQNNTGGGVSGYQLVNEFRKQQRQNQDNKKTKAPRVKSVSANESSATASDSSTYAPANTRKRVREQTINYSETQSRAQKSRIELSLLKKAADEGDIEAQYNLGMCYYYGDGVAKDLYFATEWFSNAAKQNHSLSQLWLGKCYLSGEGCDMSASEAAKWLKKAAQQNVAEAQYILATLYRDGNGVLKDPTLADNWMRKAADNGWKEATRALEK